MRVAQMAIVAVLSAWWRQSVRRGGSLLDEREAAVVVGWVDTTAARWAKGPLHPPARAPFRAGCTPRQP